MLVYVGWYGYIKLLWGKGEKHYNCLLRDIVRVSFLSMFNAKYLNTLSKSSISNKRYILITCLFQTIIIFSRIGSYPIRKHLKATSLCLAIYYSYLNFLRCFVLVLGVLCSIFYLSPTTIAFPFIPSLIFLTPLPWYTTSNSLICRRRHTSQHLPRPQGCIRLILCLRCTNSLCIPYTPPFIQ